VKLRFIFAFEDTATKPPTLHRVGDVADVKDDLAKTLIKEGKAEPVAPPLDKDDKDKK